MSFFENPSNNWIRWVVLVPLTVLTYVIAPVIIKIAYDLINHFYQDLSPFYVKYVVAFISGFTAGGLLVYIPYKFAPKWKFPIAVFFLLLGFVGVLYTLYLGYSPNPEYNANTENIATLIGAGYVLYSNENDI